MPTTWFELAFASLSHSELLAWLVKLTALCLAAAVAVALFQRRSPALAHHIWIWAIIGICLLPLLTLIVPQWSLRVMPEAEDERQTVRRADDRVASADNLPSGALPEIELRESNEGKASQAPTTSPSPVSTFGGKQAEDTAESPLSQVSVETTKAPSSSGSGWFHLGWPQTTCLIWAFGAFGLLTRLAFALLEMTRLVKRSPQASPELRSTVDEIAESLQVLQRYNVRTLASAAMPMACWLGRWLILLPEDIVDWPADIRRTVIAHELGHIARRDAWSDFLVQIVWRTVWFHPLLWLARHSVPRLRERACDEWVLSTGRIGPREYADHLLEVVTRCAQPVTTMAPAMARGHELERRLRAIVSTRPFSWSRGPAARIVTVACCLLLSGLLAATRAAPTSPLPGSGEQMGSASSVILRRSAEPVAADAPAITVSGVVVTPEGKPVPEAIVLLRAESPHFYSMGLQHGRQLLAETRTDAQGRFLLEKIGIPLRHASQIKQLLANQGGARLLVWADGRALAWAEVKGLTQKAPLRIVLAPEAKVMGVVHDKTGKGVGGVRITMAGITKETNYSNQMFLEGDDLRLFFMEGSPEGTLTNKDGRFALHHLPTDRRIAVHLTKPGWEGQSLFVDTGDSGSKEMNSNPGNKDKPTPVQHSPMDMTIEAGQVAEVRVLDHTGHPVPGGGIQVSDSKNFGAGWGDVNLRGEAQICIAKPGIYAFTYTGDPLTAELGTRVTAEFKPNDKSRRVELWLPESKWLSGKVLDAETGKGIIGAYLSYGKSPKADGKESGQYSTAVSGPDGSFRIPVAVGPGSLGFMHPVFGYFPPVYGNTPSGKEPPQTEINVPEAGQPAPVTFSLGKGLQIRGTVNDANGKPAAGASVSFYPDTWLPDTTATTDREGGFELLGLSPYKSGKLVVQAAEGAATIPIEANSNQPITQTIRKHVEIRLKQGGVVITGRVLHNGKPRAGVVMKLNHTIGKALPTQPIPGRPGAFSDSNQLFPAGELKTDADGRYRIGGVEAGERFGFAIEDPDNMRDDRWPYQTDTVYAWDKTVPENTPEVQLPDVNLVATTQVLRGVVVDPKGHPVAGVTVSASFLDGHQPSRPKTRQVYWTESDTRGRLEIRDLPELPIELMAYKNNPGDQEIKFTTRVRPKLNQQDIRIVIDPRLHEEIESLDEPKKGPIDSCAANGSVITRRYTGRLHE
jgi:beta-lactamase regulating signal transducer with metallopeptidase domain